MKWKIIGEKSIGTSHIQSGKPCEDSISYNLIQENDKEILLCCLSDGAGSAKYAKDASTLATTKAVEELTKRILENKRIDESFILTLAELLYEELVILAKVSSATLNEYSCTFLGCVLYEDSSIFFQIGDGIIIREDGCGNYTTIWLPQNGEYSNTTTFLIDDSFFGNLKIQKLDQPINEIALTTDGLQMLILNNETNNIHKPFLYELFKWLRLADTPEKTNILSKKLAEYLSSEKINTRTDDDKTLFLATRLSND